MNNKSLIAGIVTGLIVGALLYESGFLISTDHGKLWDTYQQIERRVIETQASIDAIQEEYDQVSEDLEKLGKKYDDLLEDYSFLLYDYNELSSYVDGLENGVAAIPETDIKVHTAGVPRNRYNLTYTLEITSDGNGNLTLHWIVPKNSSYQRVYSIRYSEDPDEYLIDDNGNILAHFRMIFDLSETKEISLSCIVVSFIDLYVSDWGNIEYDPESFLYTKYIVEEEYIEVSNPQIVARATELTKNIQDPKEKAKAIQRWVTENVEHTGFSSETRGAAWALQTGKGDCTEFATLFIALSRASGIPARMIDGIANTLLTEGGDYSWTNVGHDWVEIYLPNAGWVWIDPTYDWFDGSDGVHISLQHGTSSDILGRYFRYTWSPNGSSFNVEEHFTISLTQ